MFKKKDKKEEELKVELVTVGETNNYYLIPLIKGLFDSEEIPYFIKGEHLINMISPLDIVEIQVHSDYVEKALELLKEFQL